MQSVTVGKDELLSKVKANRDSHRDLFLKAQDGYRAMVIQELDKMLADARANRKIVRAISLPEPQDHTKDYDMVIAMLEMSVDSEIDLGQMEFQMYVLDNWSWSQFANATNTSYVSR